MKVVDYGQQSVTSLFHVLHRTSSLIDDAKALVANGCKYVVEGANMPTTLDATEYFQENGVYVRSW